MLNQESDTSSEATATKAPYFSAPRVMDEKVGLDSEMVPAAATEPEVEVAVTVGITRFSPEVVLKISETVSIGPTS